ncbi:MAG: DUF2063 domain-containing protein, partial [Verrucomicrobiaceae bacterium]
MTRSPASTKSTMKPSKPTDSFPMPRGTSLSEFQAAIAGAVMRPLGSGDLMRRENRPTADAFIKPNDRLTASDRLQIYNQQYWWRLLGSFAEDFRGLRAVLGERRFDRLATAYLHDCGSMSWNLRDLGARLCPYLEEHTALTAPFTALALDMARTEWARIVAFDGETRPLLDPRKFSRRPPAKMTLGLQPYITLLELHHPADHLLKRLKRSEGAAASNAVTGGLRPRKVRLTSKPLAAPLYLAVHRLDLLVYYKRLEPEAFHLLTALSGGIPLQDACGLAFARSE